jgi:hypothetical protein
MTQQRIVWTTSPNGAEVVETPDGLVNRLRVSVTASPRLDSTSGLLVGEFPSFVDWPTTVGGLAFHIEIRSGTTTLQFPLTPDPDAPFPPDPNVWQKIIGAWTTVETHDFDDHTATPVLSYPEAVAAGYFADAYSDTVLVSPLVPPSPAQWQSAPGLPEFWRLAEADLDGGKAALRAKLAEHGALTAADVTDGTGNLDPVQLANVIDLFLGGSSTIEESVAPADPVPTPEFDFHRAIAMTSQYPMLQRKLGLVIDLIASVPVDVAGVFDVRVVPDPDPSAVELHPWTRARVERTSFAPEPRDPGLVDHGKLLVGDGSRFATMTLDADGATMKMLSHAGSILFASDSQAPEALASLRSAGVGLAMADRGKFVFDALVRAKAHNTALTNGAEVVLFAEDLVRGYRIDVWETAHGRWSSLMTRDGTLTVGGVPAPGIDAIQLSFPLLDEGFVSTNPTVYDSDPGVFRLPESMFTWTGWSLANPQPGKVLDDPSPGNTAGVTDPALSDAPQAALDVTVDAHPVPGSLPVLRFGQSYRLRARAVDVAGNGPDFDADEPDTAYATDEFPYLRYEPVAAPEVLLHDPRTEGESVTRLVIRSDGPSDTAPDSTERHIAPATSSWQMAELHGLLDRTVGGRVGPDPLKYGAISLRERGGFGVRTGADGTIVAHPQAQPRPAGGLPLPDSTYHYPVPQVDINYLPDVLARGATMWPLPGSTNLWDTFGFEPFDTAGTSTWPDYVPFRLVLRKGASAPVFSDRVLTLGLDKAQVVEVNLAGSLVEGDQDLLAVYRWVEQKIREQHPDWEPALRLGTAAGVYWAFTPPRKLTLVHAVRVPLKAPRLGNLSVNRLAASTEANIVAVAEFDRASTSRVDVTGAWIDCVDDPTERIESPDPSSFERPSSALAFSIDADRLLGAGDVLDDELRISDPHRFGDTKHRVVGYQATAVSRFTEYFVERLAHTTGASPGIEHVAIGKPIVPGSAVVKSADGTVTYTAGVEYTVEPGTGQITLKVKPKLGLPGTQGINVGTALDIAFLPTPHDAAGEWSDGLSIPSSARPEPPSIRYILPTFAWSELPEAGTGNLLSARLGKSVRIYLDRPWYSSGCGEQLGVVLWANPNAVASEFPDPPHHVTHWALDPLYGGPPLPSPWPTATTFPRGEIVGPLELPEFSEAEGIIAVAAHDVQFDVERQLWFCDVVVDTGLAYAPFVRLALARYQKDSLAGLELSQVVRADYAQVASDRLVGLVFEPTGRFVNVTLLGVDAPTVAGRAVVEAFIEEHDPGVVADDLGWDRVGGLQTLAATPAGQFALWSGRLRLKDNGRRRRVVVQQFELFPDYPSTGIASVPARRLVHSDIIEI